MIPIRIALVHRDNWYRGKLRVDGQFAYNVEGLEWIHVPVDKAFTLDISGWRDIDVVWVDDGKYNEMAILPRKGHRVSPVVFYVLYPTLAQHIYQSRFERVEQMADLVLLDHDNLSRWRHPSFKTRRLAYSVNDRYYRDRGESREIDVGFYSVWGHNAGRRAFEMWLKDFCRRKGYRFYGLQGRSVNTEYARLLATTKVVVHLNRTPQTRPPRIFDASACGAAVLANPMPQVSGEYFEPGVHYMVFDNPTDVYQENGTEKTNYSDEECRDVITGLEQLLDNQQWEPMAQRARQYVLACHTWQRRAVELRGILLDCFPWLREKVGEQWLYRP